jgi:hypothetical protein
MTFSVKRSEEFVNILKTNLRNQYKDKRRTKEDSIHVSDILPTSCLRKAFYERAQQANNEYTNKISDTSLLHFLRGRASEIALSELFQNQKNGTKTTAQCHLSFEGIVGTADLMRQGNKREDLDFLVIELKDTNSLKRLDFSDIVFCGYVYQLLYYLCISDVERGLLVIKYNTYEMEQIGHDAQGDLYLKRTGAKGPELCCFEVILTLDDPVRDKLKDQMLSRSNNFKKALEAGDVSSLPRLIGELKKMRCFNCDFLTRCWKRDDETADAKKLNDIDDLSDLISQPIGGDA